MMHPGKLLGGVELGGTKCVCLVGTGPDDIRAQSIVPTGDDPAATLTRIEQHLRSWQKAYGPIAALGIASFGPVDLARQSGGFGFITSTVKPGWSHTDVAGRLARNLGVPVRFDTDVNGAALAEGRWGAARGLTDYAYVTVGTGIGASLVVAGRPAYGFGHSELGHIRVARRPGDVWPGSCPYHGDCLEGLAAGPAIAARAGMPADAIPADSAVWVSVAHALGQLVHTMVLSTAPQRILMGGGVLASRPQLLAEIRRMAIDSLKGYLDLERLTGSIADYVQPPGLGTRAGPLGALILAGLAYAEKNPL